MIGSVLHIVFSTSGAGSLRKALTALGRGDHVIALVDDLSFGPVYPPDPALRAQWVETELGYTNWYDMEGEIQTFWDTAIGSEDQHVAWMSRRSPQEYAGFLEFVWRLGNTPCDVIDLTNVTFFANHLDPPARRFALGLGPIPQDEIVENDLLNQSQPLTDDLRTGCLAVWEKVRGENAPLRVIDPDMALRSAPISFFDERLLSFVQQRWLKAARIIGQTLMESWSENHNVSDLVLCSRLLSLVEDGRLESQGDLYDLTHSEVRLPAARG